MYVCNLSNFGVFTEIATHSWFYYCHAQILLGWNLCSVRFFNVDSPHFLWSTCVWFYKVLVFASRTICSTHAWHSNVTQVYFECCMAQLNDWLCETSSRIGWISFFLVSLQLFKYIWVENRIWLKTVKFWSFG